jgi:ribosome-associated protein
MKRQWPDNSSFFEDEEGIEAPPSRTRLKKDDHARQDIGERLTRLSDKELDRIDLSDEIRDAVIFARKISSHGAKKREIKHIGALLRHLDTALIQKTLDHISQYPNRKKDE